MKQSLDAVKKKLEIKNIQAVEVNKLINYNVPFV